MTITTTYTKNLTVPTMGRYWWESEPYWPDPPAPPAGAPNVVVVLLDDVGFAQLGCFGSDLSTPTFDRLAEGGLRYTNFHTTALCSPTRACVLTGRNHHSAGVGRITDLATGFPGYTARIPPDVAMIPAMLTPHGYATMGIGKWHLTPEDECHLAATRQRWPLAKGFERYYGFFGGETHQFAPELFHDNHLVDPPASYEDGYHLSEDLADTAIGWLRDLRSVDDTKPFYLYFATGACHSPHQAPADWIERYRGQFDDGWDVWRDKTFERQLATGIVPPHTVQSERPEWVPPWDELSPDARRLYARFMECFAGFLSHADAQVGRVVDELERLGELDNTLLFVLSDNGASSEGGPLGSLNDGRVWNMVRSSVEESVARIDEIGGPSIHNNYPWGWTVAGNTPYRRWKREVHEGGVADPLIVHWPARFAAADGRAPGKTEDDSGLRHQYVHAIDIVPTILDAIGIEQPAHVNGVPQRPIEGISFSPTLTSADAEDRHTIQHYEMFGCRALYQDGWKAVTYHQIQFDEPGLDQVPWELYHLEADPAETIDLAESEPDRLQAMIERWWVEAARYQVLPLDNRPFSDFVFGRPNSVPERHRYVIWPHRPAIPESVAPNVKNRSHAVTASVVIGEQDPEGVLVAQGSVLGGWSLYVIDGELRYAHNLSGSRVDRVSAPLLVDPGEHTLAFRFDKTAEFQGDVTLLIDDEEVGRGSIPFFTPHRFSLTGIGLAAGYQPSMAVVDDYRAPFRFNQEITQVVITVEGPPFVDPEAEAQIAIETQ